jgi:ketosteroid isomerase-like protein
MTEPFRELFAAIDSEDSDAFVAFLTDDAVFRYGSWEPVVGRENVRLAVAGFFQTIKALRHNVLNTWQVGDVIFSQGEVTYTRLDEKQVTVPFLNLFKMQGDLIQEYSIYIDPTPLFA